LPNKAEGKPLWRIEFWGGAGKIALVSRKEMEGINGSVHAEGGGGGITIYWFLVETRKQKASVILSGVTGGLICGDKPNKSIGILGIVY